MSVEAAFLLLVAKNERSLPGHELTLAKHDRGSSLHFAPGEHVFWSNQSSTVALGAWQHQGDETRSHWKLTTSASQ